MGEGRLPYFPFYVGDWLSSSAVQRMTLEEEGAYLRLLCYQWQDGHIPDDPGERARLLGVSGEAQARLWRRLESCFEVIENGKLVNPRLATERRQVVRRKEKLSEAGRKGRQKQLSGATPGATSGPPPGQARAYTESESDTKAETDTETEEETTNEGSSLRSSPSVESADSATSRSGEEANPTDWMHDLWHEALGSGRRINLTEKRRTKYQKMYAEHLSDADEPQQAWRAILWAVTQSDHHMSERSYQMPESLLRNAERRETWIERTLEAIQNGGGQKNRKRRRQRQQMATEIERIRAEGGVI